VGPCAATSPAQHGFGGGGGGRGGENEAMAARVRAKLDFVNSKGAHRQLRSLSPKP